MTIDKLIETLKLFWPKYYNTLTRVLVIAGISLLTRPIWVDLINSFLVKFSFPDIGPYDQLVGLAVIVVALIYNTTNRWIDTNSNSRPERLKQKELQAADFVELCRKVFPYMNDNKYVFESFSPNSPTNDNPLETSVELWELVKKDTLEPNNEVIFELIETNEALIPTVLAETFSKWKNHIYAFKKHIEDEQFDYSQFQFPTEVEDVIHETCFSDSLKQKKSKSVLTWLSKRLKKDEFQISFLIGSFLFNPNSKRDIDLVVLLIKNTDALKIIRKLDSIKFWFKLIYRRNLHISVFKDNESDNFNEFVDRNKFKVKITHG